MLARAAMKRTSMLARHMTAAAGTNPKVFFDIEIDEKETGRIVMEVLL
jgi:hypothetical protein